ncbi:MAG: glycosyltransferase [Gemmatimonadetes bacterium]|nr:glycosyltransferase [Gemmatimonadota bacterium]
MRILHLSKFYPPDPGGLEHIVASLAEGAAQAGHDVRVVCARGSRWKGSAAKEQALAIRNGVTIHRLATPMVVWSQPIALGYLGAARWKADVVYVHRPHPLADLAVSLTRPTGLIVFHHSDVQRQRAFRTLYRPLAHAVARRAYASVVGAKTNLQNADDLGPAGIARARVIPFGVDEMRFTVKSVDDRPKAFGPADQAVGLFVGRLVSYKGLDVLLRAVAGTALRVVIVGEGPLRAQLEAEIQSLGIGDQVRLAARVSERDLPSFYQTADYLLLPSTTPAEMFGVTMLEAMACGKPLISSSVASGMREVNLHDVTGLQVPPGDHEALRQAMLRLVADESLRQRMGAAGRRRVEERFTVRGMIAAHLDLCEEVAKANTGGWGW